MLVNFFHRRRQHQKHDQNHRHHQLKQTSRNNGDIEASPASRSYLSKAELQKLSQAHSQQLGLVGGRDLGKKRRFRVFLW